MSFLYLLEGIRTPLLDTLMSALTQLGGETVFMALAVTIFWCADKALGYYMLSVGFFGTVANQFMKLVFHVPRPWVLDPDFTIVEKARAAATGYSFPSGHTQNVFAGFGCAARWTKKRTLRAALWAVVVLVAFSRMYLGVHTPLDVGVAFAMGLALVFGLYPVFRDMEARPRRMGVVLAVMLVLCAAYTAFAELWSFPADMDAANLASGRESGWKLLGAVCGILPAWRLDTTRTHFDTRAPLFAQVVKTVLGLAVVLALKTLLKAPLLALFGGSGAAHAVRYFLVVLFAAALWPMTFRFFAGWGKKRPQT